MMIHFKQKHYIHPSESEVLTRIKIIIKAIFCDYYEKKND